MSAHEQEPLSYQDALFLLDGVVLIWLERLSGRWVEFGSNPNQTAALRNDLSTLGQVGEVFGPTFKIGEDQMEQVNEYYTFRGKLRKALEFAEEVRRSDRGKVENTRGMWEKLGSVLDYAGRVATNLVERGELSFPTLTRDEHGRLRPLDEILQSIR